MSILLPTSLPLSCSFAGDIVAIRYDTIAEFNVDPKAECDQLNLAHETKTNKRQCTVQVQYLCRQSRRNQKDYGGKDL